MATTTTLKEVEGAMPIKNDFEYIRGLDAQGNPIRINKKDVAHFLGIYEIPAFGDRFRWIKIGELPNIAQAATNESLVSFRISGLRDYAHNDIADYLCRVGTRDSLYFSVIQTAGIRQAEFGTIEKGNKIEIWVKYTGYYMCTTKVQFIVMSKLFTPSVEARENAPAGNFVKTNDFKLLKSEPIQ